MSPRCCGFNSACMDMLNLPVFVYCIDGKCWTCRAGFVYLGEIFYVIRVDIQGIIPNHMQTIKGRV